MFSSFSIPFSVTLPKLVLGGKDKEVVPSVQTYNVETDGEKSARTLKHLIKINHANHSIIHHNLQYHNHTPHILGSAYILGANTEQLTNVYEAESKDLEPWVDSPGEISKDDWRDFLGKRNYQRGFIDFFEDRLVAFGYDWKKMLEHYLLEGEEPLINSLCSGLGHPLIHLGYAYELNSRTIGLEALGLAACFYSDIHKYIDDPSYARPSSYKSPSTLEILNKIREDHRFIDLFDHQGPDNIDLLLSKREAAVLDHWNAWQNGSAPDELKASLAELQRTAVALVVATNFPSSSSDNDTSGAKTRQYDFYLVHLLTTSHAIRILLPLIPSRFHVSLLRQWFFFTITVYISQHRPRIDLSLVDDYNITVPDGWKYVNQQALTSIYATDAHYVKALRAMRVAEETWGTLDGYWEKAVMRMAEDFKGWGGFGAATEGYKPVA